MAYADCRKCENLVGPPYACKVYGPECEKAARACLADRLKNYKPKTPAEFNAGENVYVVERDEVGDAWDVGGYIYLAKVADAVILSPYINDLETLEETMEYHIEQTAENCDTQLSVFPAADCYKSREQAKQALKEEMEG